MIRTTAYEKPLGPLIEWIEARHPANTCSAFQRDDAPPEPFLAFALEHQPPAHTHLKFWSSRVRPGENTNPRRPIKDNWLGGFPHKHSWGRQIITMICYLTDCEGGELGLGGYDKADEYQLFSPAPGLCVFCNADEWHGVREVTAGERLAIIVTGFDPASLRGASKA